MRGRALLALLPVLLAGPARADDAAAMAAVANGFYAARIALGPAADGIPGATGRVRLAPFLSPELIRALADAAAADTRFHAAMPSAPSLMEGDLFSSLLDGPTAWKVDVCAPGGRRCTVTLTHAVPGRAAVTWRDTLLMTKTAGGWRIGDIAYDPGLPSGNSGRLSEVLEMVESEAR